MLADMSNLFSAPGSDATPCAGPGSTTAQPLAWLGPLRTRFKPAQLLGMFQRLLGPSALTPELTQGPKRFYDRIFSLRVILWYLVFQRINPDPTLQEVVTDLHQGGADAFSEPGRPPLSERIVSWATTAYSSARQRLPLPLLVQALAAQGRQILGLAQGWEWHRLRPQLLDGSTVRLRPLGDLPQHFPPPGRGKKTTPKRYWCFMRVVVSFCVSSAVALGCAVGAVSVSEQTLAAQIILGSGAAILWVGDRNFGVFRIVQVARQVGASVLVRLTQSRARKLAGKGLRAGRVYLVQWGPSRADQQQPGCSSAPVPGRLIVVRVHRQGFRAQVIYLFTDLLDEQKYPLQELVELYGARWHVELNLRYLKTQMELEQLSCKSADMAQKEWYAGLLAYNLIRAVMLCAAVQAGVRPLALSFSAARRQVERWLENYGADRRGLLASWEQLLAGVAVCRQPKRKKARPAEPRAKRPVRESFPPLWGSRAKARRQIKKYASKT